MFCDYRQAQNQKQIDTTHSCFHCTRMESYVWRRPGAMTQDSPQRRLGRWEESAGCGWTANCRGENITFEETNQRWREFEIGNCFFFLPPPPSPWSLTFRFSRWKPMHMICDSWKPIWSIVQGGVNPFPRLSNLDQVSLWLTEKRQKMKHMAKRERRMLEGWNNKNVKTCIDNLMKMQ